MGQIATFYDHIKEISQQERISLIEALQTAKGFGIDGLEISQNNLLGREDEVGRELSYVGMEVSSIPAYFDFGRDEDVDRQSEPTLEAARYLGAKKILVIPGFFRPEDGEEERSGQMERIADCLNRLAEKAAGYGVSLVMEDFDSPLAPFRNISGLRFFLDRCPGLSCCFDTGNFRFSGEEELSAYDALKDRIGHVHLKDRSYTSLNGEPALTAMDGKALYPCPVGGGNLRIEELIARTKRDGYHGIYTIEHYGAARMLNYLERSAAWVQERLA